MVLVAAAAAARFGGGRGGREALAQAHERRGRAQLDGGRVALAEVLEALREGRGTPRPLLLVVKGGFP